jgi:23S rRNA (uracil1939-C5)-methyltransferase
MAEKKLHALMIDKLVPGGLGLGRLANGIVVLVRYVLPGEEVLVCETEHKKDYINAALKEVLLSSPDRIEPPCPVYGRCGGCDLQHAGPAAQLRLKKIMLADSLQRSVPTIFHDRSLPIEEPLAAPAQFNYRQRLRLQVDDRGSYGFFHPASHTVEPVLQCLLAREQLNSVLGQLHSLRSFQNLVRNCNSFELLFNPAENDTIVLLNFKRKPRPADSSLAAELKNQVNNLAAVLMLVEDHGLYDPLTKTFSVNPPILSYTPTIAPLESNLILTWEAGGFCQVNLEQNSTLINLVLGMIGDGTHKNILDLYCGYGNFSLPAAKFAAAVLGIDTQNAAIRSAKRNVLLNGVHNCIFEKKQVPAAVAAISAAKNSFDTVILDPPRRGAPGIVAQLPELGAERIIYISCNPATLARDLLTLTTANYRLVRLVPVDMFPQTHHLECVALLHRSGRSR